MPDLPWKSSKDSNPFLKLLAILFSSHPRALAPRKRRWSARCHRATVRKRSVRRAVVAHGDATRLQCDQRQSARLVQVGAAAEFLLELRRDDRGQQIRILSVHTRDQYASSVYARRCACCRRKGCIMFSHGMRGWPRPRGARLGARDSVP